MRRRALLPAALAAVLCGLVSCARKDSPLVIWTDRSEFASYVELFNKTHSDVKAVVVYKQNPAESLAEPRSSWQGAPPDIVAGHLLKSDRTTRQFVRLDSLFSAKRIRRESFYQNILAYGKERSAQLLVPVSFNLPAIIFSETVSASLPQAGAVSLEELRGISAARNQKDSNGSFTAMGFAPSWSSDFLYASARLFHADFTRKDATFAWNQEGIDAFSQFMREWTATNNASTAAEQEFSFKYLYTPAIKYILSGHGTFAFISSSELFQHTSEQLQGIDFRWLSHGDEIPVADDIVSMGIYRKSGKKKPAREFLQWFFTAETQHSLLDRRDELNLGSMGHSIAGGFSSIKSVSDNILQRYYGNLAGDMPADEQLAVPGVLPLRWQSLKARVVLPYLQDISSTEKYASARTLEQRLEDWKKQFM